MANEIWKFPLEVTDRQSVEMPPGSQILCCQVQGTQPCLWAVCQAGIAARESRQIEIKGTGHPMEECERTYIDTFQLNHGALVFHVFER